MSKIIVSMETEDGLSSELWEFSTHCPPHMNLVRYSVVTRKSRRHKWVGDFWDDYHRREGSLQKPEFIPAHVVREARRMLFALIESSNVYIGASPDEENINDPKKEAKK